MFFVYELAFKKKKISKTGLTIYFFFYAYRWKMPPNEKKEEKKKSPLLIWLFEKETRPGGASTPYEGWGMRERRSPGALTKTDRMTNRSDQWPSPRPVRSRIAARTHRRAPAVFRPPQMLSCSAYAARSVFVCPLPARAPPFGPSVRRGLTDRCRTHPSGKQKHSVPVVCAGSFSPSRLTMGGGGWGAAAAAAASSSPPRRPLDAFKLLARCSRSHRLSSGFLTDFVITHTHTFCNTTHTHTHTRHAWYDLRGVDRDSARQTHRLATFAIPHENTTLCTVPFARPPLLVVDDLLKTIIRRDPNVLYYKYQRL